MPLPALPMEALPLWMRLNNVELVDVKVARVEGRGHGLVCERDLSTKGGTFDKPTVLTVPRHLVLDAEAVGEYAKEDRNFRLLLDAAGHKTPRGDILLFLLVQLVKASSTQQATAPSSLRKIAVSNPWTEYFRFMPQDDVPVPTMWSEAEQALLRGTSLEPALRAKLAALAAEFDALRDASSAIPFWNAAFWGAGAGQAQTGPDDNGGGDLLDDIDMPDAAGWPPRRPVQLRDWALVDALYRSRSLELPGAGAGPGMVPVLDMANHSSARPTARYEVEGQNTIASGGGRREGEVVLLLRPDVELAAGDEVTIDYAGGRDGAKPAAEMLFNYGFVDPAAAAAAAGVLVFPLDVEPADDPLARAKLEAYGGPPVIRVSRSSGKESSDNKDGGGSSSSTSADVDQEEEAFVCRWECPFGYLSALNEEDGLEFRVLQETDGARRHLRVFWQGRDATARAREDPRALVRGHRLEALFELRVVMLVKQHLTTRLSVFLGEEKKYAHEPLLPVDAGARAECVAAAALLRRAERRILEEALRLLGQQQATLLEDETVAEHLSTLQETMEMGDSTGHEISSEDDYS